MGACLSCDNRHAAGNVQCFMNHSGTLHVILFAFQLGRRKGQAQPLSNDQEGETDAENDCGETHTARAQARNGAKTKLATTLDFFGMTQQIWTSPHLIIAHSFIPITDFQVARSLAAKYVRCMRMLQKRSFMTDVVVSLLFVSLSKDYFLLRQN